MTNIDKIKTVKEFDADKLSVDDRAKLIRAILINMNAQINGTTNAGVLLAGDPGTGKTSLGRSVAQLLGLSLVTVEVPLLLEEHIINIPFVQYTPKDNKVKKFSVKGRQTGEFSVELAQSNLLSQLKKQEKLDDDTYLESIYSGRFGQNIIRIFERLGGTKNTIPPMVEKIRNRFTTILFLDEYFRQTGGNIRNMLRSILNRKLGLDDLPKQVYVLFASNINDEGVESIPHNNQFRVLNVNHPSKESWFSYTLSNAKKNSIAISEEVQDLFWQSITDSKDGNEQNKIWGENSVRISPRRLEQILLYTEACLPIKDMKAALSTYTNLMQNFKKEDGTFAKSSEAFSENLTKLIQSYVPEFRPALNPPTSWRDTLHHQLTRSIRLGPIRSYIPTISGTFGIGKTTAMEDISKSFGLGLIYIDCSNYSAEDITGTPIPDTDEDGKPSVLFAESKLEKFILREAEKVKPEKPVQGYNYIIFFDELNRTSTKALNSLRKLLLEKEFDNGEPLPEGSLIVAAINPVDHGGGVIELTSHMRDVMDIINADPDWKTFMDWLEEKNSGISNLFIEDAVRNIITEFASNFSESGKPSFILNLGAHEPMYVSPREFTQIYGEACIDLDETYEDLKLEYSFTHRPKQEDFKECDLALREVMSEYILGMLSALSYKHQVEFPTDTMHLWLTTDPKTSILHNLKEEELKSDASNLFEELFKNITKPLIDYSEIDAYFKNNETSVIIGDIEKIALSKISEMDKRNYPLRNFSGDEAEDTGKMVGAITYLYREAFIAVYATEMQDILENELKISSSRILSEIIRKNKLDDKMYSVVTEMAVEMYGEN